MMSTGSDNLKLQLEIADAIKRQTEGIKNYAQSYKTLNENVKLLKLYNADILVMKAEEEELMKKGTEESLAQAKILRETIADSEKQIKQLSAINKKLFSMKNLLRAGGNELKNQLLPSFSEIYNRANAIDKAIKNTVASMGIGSNQSKTLRDNIIGAAKTTATLGITTEMLTEAQGNYANETGRSMLLSEQTLVNMSELAKATNMSVGEMSALSGQMEAFGFGARQAITLVKDIRDVAEGQGVNSDKVIKSFQKNLGLLNKLNFKGGAKGMAKMVAYSEKFKVNMDTIASSAKAVWSPEGAIEAAASLQMMGGGFAALADPFQLMFDARNDPQKYLENITKSLDGIATYNKKGELVISTYEMQRLEEAGKALGISSTEMAEMAKQKTKMDKISGDMFGMSDDDKALLGGLATMGKQGSMVVNMVDKNDVRRDVLLKNMDIGNRKLLQQQIQTSKDLAIKNTTFDAAWKGLKEQLMVMGTDILIPLMDTLHPTITTLSEWLVSFGVFSKGLIKGFMELSTFGKVLTAAGVALVYGLGKGLMKVGMWIANGVSLAIGFNKYMKGKGLITKLLGGGGPSPGGFGQQGGSIGPAQPRSQSRMMSPKRMRALGKAASGAAKGMLAFGAAVLMIGGGIAIAALGLSQLVSSFSTLTGPQIGGALGAVVAVMGGFVTMVYLLASASVTAIGPLIALGFAMLLIGGGIAIAAYGISLMVDSFSNFFSVIGDGGSEVLLAGLGFAAMGVGIGLLTLSLLSLSTASLFALPGLLMLGAATAMVVGAATALDNAGGGEGISKAVTSINNVDMGKLNALKELSVAMSIWGAFGSKPIVIQMEVGGEIKLGGSNGETFDISELSPSQVTELKNLIFQRTEMDGNGG